MKEIVENEQTILINVTFEEEMFGMNTRII